MAGSMASPERKVLFRSNSWHDRQTVLKYHDHLLVSFNIFRTYHSFCSHIVQDGFSRSLCFFLLKLDKLVLNSGNLLNIFLCFCCFFFLCVCVCVNSKVHTCT